MQHQYFGDSFTVVLRENFVALKAYIRKRERSKINGISFHLKKKSR